MARNLAMLKQQELLTKNIHFMLGSENITKNWKGKHEHKKP